MESFLALLLVPLGLYLGETGVEKVLLAGSVVLVLIIEVLNSAIETVVDRFGGEQHQLSGRAKDQGSAAVFLSLSLVLLVWGGCCCFNRLSSRGNYQQRTLPVSR